MPVVEVDPDELRDLTGLERDDETLREDLFSLGLEFEGATADGAFQLEFAPDRLDRLSVEGIARSLRYQYGEDRGVDVPTTNDAEWTIEVRDTPPERPYVTGAIVRGLDLDAAGFDSLIQLQEKLHATMGRERAKGAIGVHDLTMLKGVAAGGEEESGGGTRKSIVYTSMDPDEERFVPLESDEELTPREVTERHHIGREYANLVAHMDRYPAIYDDIGLFSFPPIINGRRTEVSTESRDLLIEMTGTDQWTLDRMLAIVCYTLEARGGRIERVDVAYDDDSPGEFAGQTLERPDFEVRQKRITHERIESLLGISLEGETIVDCLERSGLSATETETGDAYEVGIPPYRTDVLHPMDLVDDIGRAYGFNELAPRYPDVSTIGGRHERSRLEDAVRDTLVGLGFEDLLNFYMTNEGENFERMGMPAGDADTDSQPVGTGDPVTIKSPYSKEYTILRTWALPSILQVLENNTHRAYPQELAEIGFAAICDESENTGVAEYRTVAAVLAAPDVSYEDARTRLQSLARAFECDLDAQTDHPSFIDGRCATIVIDGEEEGVLGEVAPEILIDRDLEVPVAAFEVRLDAFQ